MGRKNYDELLADREPPDFTVCGQDFNCRRSIPAYAWKKLIRLMTSDDVDEHDANVQFFSVALVRKDRQRFLDLLNGPDDNAELDELDEENALSIEVLNAIARDLMDYYTGKLKESVESSSPGSQQTQRPRNVVSLNPQTLSA